MMCSIISKGLFLLIICLIQCEPIAAFSPSFPYSSLYEKRRNAFASQIENYPRSSNPLYQNRHPYYGQEFGPPMNQDGSWNNNNNLVGRPRRTKDDVPLIYSSKNTPTSALGGGSLFRERKNQDSSFLNPSHTRANMDNHEFLHHMGEFLAHPKQEISNEAVGLLSQERQAQSHVSQGVDPIPENSASDPIIPEAQRRYAEPEILPSGKDNWNFGGVKLTTLSIGTLMLFLIITVMVLALRVHLRNRSKNAQEWIRQPVVQPITTTSDGLQPSFSHIIFQDHLTTEPIRIKAKGLLERRGSNTSLKLDLGSSMEGNDLVFSPTRECTPENFLLTAGNRMSRKQLRQCFKDSRILHAEFWQIPTNHPDKCDVAGAAAKNRYRTVLPNEETRVILHKAPPDSPEFPASQFINANYIKGYEGEEKVYIATQGPLAHTIEDLWLMVLQERSPAVVMITRLKEKGRVKCELYIPSYTSTYGSIHVTVKQVIQKTGYTIRQIVIKHGDEVHTTLHFWFTSWPDHKAPSSARHLLAMASEVEAARMEARGPIIVHCSAGIGRTGCFIAVSIGKLQLLEEDCVDILSIVCQMRLDRGGMVQTAEQYEFIHRALALYEASLPTTSSAD